MDAISEVLILDFIDINLMSDVFIHITWVGARLSLVSFRSLSLLEIWNDLVKLSGCSLSNVYVAIGQPVVTDRCGNLCYCSTAGLVSIALQLM